MSCEYCDEQRNMLSSASSFSDVTAEETIIEGVCVLPADETEEAVHKHVIVTYMTDGCEIRTKPISYCPFCGRKL